MSVEEPVRAQSADERSKALEEARGDLDRMIGLPGVKSEVKRLMSFLEIQLQRRQQGLRESSQSLHFVFTGNPGTGKTTVARILGKIFFGFGILKTSKFVECDRANLVAAFLGQTAIKTDEVIQSALDGLLFIDEAYALAGDAKKFGHGDSFGEEAINTLLKRMEDSRDRLIVVVAGYPAPMEAFLESNPGLKSRFTRFIRFEDYSVPDLCRIFAKMCRDAEYTLTPLACANAFLLFAVAYHQRDEKFGNARTVRNVYEMALSRQAERLSNIGGQLNKSDLVTIDSQDIPFEMVKAFDPRALNNRAQLCSCRGGF
jgi:SpoVK/Ycf46/Vps4 family AAA+-type ATPase